MTEAGGWPVGYRLRQFEAVGSTNALALEAARGGEPGGVWFVAERQTAGRGRRGRAWTSEAGNLYASLLLIDPMPAARLGELPLVTAVAVHEAVADILPPTRRPELEIKWPNDLLLGGAKIAGILVEGAIHDGQHAVVVGIGVNCAHHPADVGYAATDLASAGIPTEPGALFARLARRMADRLDDWRSAPFEPIRRRWLERARGVGKRIEVRLQSETLAGTFEGLDPDGRLILLASDGSRRSISAGDVFFG